MKSPRPYRSILLHAVRVLLVAATAWAIHHAHQTRAVEQGDRDSSALTTFKWRPIFPDGVSLVERDDDTADVLDADGDVCGTLLQTSPLGDNAIGFSGPSNVVVVLDDEGIIIHTEIVDSGDTVEHVRAVNRDTTFTKGWSGLRLDVAARHRIDAVSGATLTSTAANQAVIARLGGKTESLRFPQPLTLELVHRLFPDATEIRPLDSPEQTEVIGANGPLGFVIRPSRQNIESIRYHGPSDILIGLTPDLTITGVAFLETYDNEQYYGYVVEDRYFQKTLTGLSFPDFRDIDMYEAGIEGVSGATMTSLAVVDMIQEASQKFDGIHRPPPVLTPSQQRTAWITDLVANDGRSLAFIAIGCVLPFIKGRRRVAFVWAAVVFIALGLVDGLLLSQAMFVGWSRHGLSTAGGYGLIALAAVAFFFPVAAGRNIYCSHLCAHGAAQMLVRNRFSKRRKLPQAILKPLHHLPAALVAATVIVSVTGSTFSVVNLEAFDAYLWPVCGWIPLAIAVIGLIASLFEPMAYCRYACPTGSLLNYLRRHRRSDRWTRVDWFATTLTATAWLIALA